MPTAASRSAFISARIAAAQLRGTGCPNGQAAPCFGRAIGNPNIYGIAVGSFAGPNFPPPTFSVWDEVMPLARSGDGDRALFTGSFSVQLTQHLLLTNSPPSVGHGCARIATLCGPHRG